MQASPSCRSTWLLHKVVTAETHNDAPRCWNVPYYIRELLQSQEQDIHCYPALHRLPGDLRVNPQLSEHKPRSSIAIPHYPTTPLASITHTLGVEFQTTLLVFKQRLDTHRPTELSRPPAPFHAFRH